MRRIALAQELTVDFLGAEARQGFGVLPDHGGHLERGNAAGGKGAQRFAIEDPAFFGEEDRGRHFAEFLVRQAENADLRYVWVGIECLLDLDAGDVDFKHYTQIIRADRNSANSCQSGTSACPFHTIGSALNLAWDGAEIRIRGGVYLETATITKRVRLTAENGSVRIGG